MVAELRGWNKREGPTEAGLSHAWVHQAKEPEPLEADTGQTEPRAFRERHFCC